MHSLFLRGHKCVCVWGGSISDIVSNIEKDNFTIFLSFGSYIQNSLGLNLRHVPLIFNGHDASDCMHIHYLIVSTFCLL